MRISDWSSDVCSSDLLADADRNGRRLCVRRAGRECRGLPQRILIAQEAWSPAPEYLLFAVISDSPDDFIWLEITLALVIAADIGVARRRGGRQAQRFGRGGEAADLIGRTVLVDLPLLPKSEERR